MKKSIAALTAIALLSPSVAAAQPAAQALSVKNAAVKPIRAAAKPGKQNAIGTPVLLLIGALAVGVGALAAASGGDSN